MPRDRPARSSERTPRGCPPRRRRSESSPSVRHAGHDVRKVVELKRFADDGPSGLVEKALRQLALQIPGHEYDAGRMTRVALAQLAVQRLTAKVGHAQVDQDYIISVFLHERAGTGAAGGHVDAVTEGLEEARDGRAHRGLVVHHEHVTGGRMFGALPLVGSASVPARPDIRQLDDEYRAEAMRRFHADAAAMLADDAVGNREAQTGTLPI